MLLPPTDREGQPDRENGLHRAEQAADIVRQAMLHPMEGRYKVFLIQDAHRAHVSFANKLLKTLEEPPPHVVLCLTALAGRLFPRLWALPSSGAAARWGQAMEVRCRHVGRSAQRPRLRRVWQTARRLAVEQWTRRRHGGKGRRLAS